MKDLSEQVIRVTAYVMATQRPLHRITRPEPQDTQAWAWIDERMNDATFLSTATDLFLERRELALTIATWLRKNAEIIIANDGEMPAEDLSYIHECMAGYSDVSFLQEKLGQRELVTI